MGRGVVLVVVLGVVRQRAVVLGLDAGGIAVAHLVAHHPGGVVGAVARHPAVAVARVAELALVAVHDGPVVVGVQLLLRAGEEGRGRVVAVVVHMGRGDGVVDVVLETGLLGRGARGVKLVVLALVNVGASQHLVVGGRLPAAAVAVVGARRLGRGVGIAAVGAEVQRVARHELAVGQVDGERLVVGEVAGLGDLGGDHLARGVLRLLLVAVLRRARPVDGVHEVGRVVARALEVDERVAVLVQTLGEQVGETGGRRLVHFLVLAGVGPGDGIQILIDHGLGAVGIHEVHVVLADADGAVHRMSDLGPVGGGELVGAPRPLAPAVVGGGQRLGLGLRRRVGAVGHLVPRRGAQGDEHLVEVVGALGAGVVGHRVQVRPHVRRRHGGDGAVGRGRAVLGGAEELQAHAEVAVVLQILIGVDRRQRVVDADVVGRRDIGAPGLVVVVAVVGVVAARLPAVQRHEVALVVREDTLVGMVVRHVGVTGPADGARIAVHGLLHEVAALVGDHARGRAQMAHLALVELVEVVVVVVAAVVGAPAVVAALAGAVEVLVGPGAATVLVVVEVQRLGARGPHVAEGGGDVAVDVARVAPPARVVGAGGQRLARGTVVLVAVVHGALVRGVVALGRGVHVLLTGVLAADGHVHRGGGGHRVGRRGGRGLIGADEAAGHLEGHVLRPLGRACAEAVGEPLAIVGHLRVAGRIQRTLVDGHVVDDLGHAEGGHAVGVVVEGVAIGIDVLFAKARHVLGVGRLRVRGQIDRVAAAVHHLHEVQAEEVVALVVQLHGGGHAAVVAPVERVVVLRADGFAVDDHLLAVAELDGHLVQVGQGLLLDLDVVGVEALAGDILHHLQVGAGVVGVGAHGVEARVAVGPVVAEVVAVVVGSAVVVVLVVDVARHVAVGAVVDEAGAVHPAGVLVVVGPVAVAALAAGGIEVRVALLHEEGGLRRHRAYARAGRVRVVARMPVRVIGDVAQVRLGRRVHLAEVHEEGALGLVADGQVTRGLVHRRAPAPGMTVVVAVVGAGGVVREAGRLGVARQVLRVVDLLGLAVPGGIGAVDELRVAHAARRVEHRPAGAELLAGDGHRRRGIPRRLRARGHGEAHALDVQGHIVARDDFLDFLAVDLGLPHKAHADHVVVGHRLARLHVDALVHRVAGGGEQRAHLVDFLVHAAVEQLGALVLLGGAVGDVDLHRHERRGLGDRLVSALGALALVRLGNRRGHGRAVPLALALDADDKTGLDVVVALVDDVDLFVLQAETGGGKLQLGRVQGHQAVVLGQLGGLDLGGMQAVGDGELHRGGMLHGVLRLHRPQKVGIGRHLDALLALRVHVARVVLRTGVDALYRRFRPGVLHDRQIDDAARGHRIVVGMQRFGDLEAVGGELGARLGLGQIGRCGDIALGGGDGAVVLEPIGALGNGDLHRAVAVGGIAALVGARLGLAVFQHRLGQALDGDDLVLLHRLAEDVLCLGDVVEQLAQRGLEAQEVGAHELGHLVHDHFLAGGHRHAHLGAHAIGRFFYDLAADDEALRDAGHQLVELLAGGEGRVLVGHLFVDRLAVGVHFRLAGLVGLLKIQRDLARIVGAVDGHVGVVGGGEADVDVVIGITQAPLGRGLLVGRGGGEHRAADVVAHLGGRLFALALALVHIGGHVALMGRNDRAVLVFRLGDVGVNVELRGSVHSPAGAVLHEQLAAGGHFHVAVALKRLVEAVERGAGAIEGRRVRVHGLGAVAEALPDGDDGHLGRLAVGGLDVHLGRGRRLLALDGLGRDIAAQVPLGDGHVAVAHEALVEAVERGALGQRVLVDLETGAHDLLGQWLVGVVVVLVLHGLAGIHVGVGGARHGVVVHLRHEDERAVDAARDVVVRRGIQRLVVVAGVGARERGQVERQLAEAV